MMMMMLQVERVLEQLFSAGARPADVGVISPYSGQVQRIFDKWRS
jgi:superfamily I DNA and/or RNA helicase